MGTKKISRAIKELASVKLEQRFLRHYRTEVARLKKWCEENDITLYSFSDERTLAHYICVQSKNELNLHERRRDIETDEESYFLTEEDYDKYCEEYE